MDHMYHIAREFATKAPFPHGFLPPTPLLRSTCELLHCSQDANHYKLLHSDKDALNIHLWNCGMYAHDIPQDNRSGSCLLHHGRFLE